MNDIYFPVNCEQLNKGDTIDRETLEEITGTSAESKDFSLKVLGIKEQIEAIMLDMNKPVTICQFKDTLRVLTDSEASEYQQRAFVSGIGRMRRSHKKTLQVNVDNLTDKEQAVHDRRIQIQGAILAGVRQSKKLTQVAYNTDRQAIAG